MEELVTLLLQIVFEVIIQGFGSAGFDWIASRASKDNDGCGWLVLFIVFGAIFGGLSLLLFPKVLLATVALRVANLVLAPLFAGGCSAALAKWGVLSGSPFSHFWRGFWFALAFGSIRFVWAAR